MCCLQQHERPHAQNQKWFKHGCVPTHTLNIVGLGEKTRSCPPLNQILIFNTYVVGYNACRHVVWAHYVLRRRRKKESVHEDESRSAVTMLPFNMAGFFFFLGGVGVLGSWSVVSYPLRPIVRPRTAQAVRHRSSPAAWQETLPINTHIMLLWHTLTSKTRLYSERCWHVSKWLMDIRQGERIDLMFIYVCILFELLTVTQS